MYQLGAHDLYLGFPLFHTDKIPCFSTIFPGYFCEFPGTIWLFKCSLGIFLGFPTAGRTLMTEDFPTIKWIHWSLSKEWNLLRPQLIRASVVILQKKQCNNSNYHFSRCLLNFPRYPLKFKNSWYFHDWICRFSRCTLCICLWHGYGNPVDSSR